MRRQRREATVSLFPFLSILVCLMGVLAFITVAVALLSASNPVVELRPVDSAAAGRPGGETAKRPVFVECHGNRLVIHSGERQVPHEVALEAIAAESSRFMELIERLNARREREYVIFAVYPDGLECFEQGRRLAEERDIDLGFEPMLAGWRLGLDGRRPGGT